VAVVVVATVDGVDEGSCVCAVLVFGFVLVGLEDFWVSVVEG
jgi:predicted ABC-type sugar transport system permease subunit